MNPPEQRDPASYSAQELADPRIDPTTLRQIAAARPDLWRLIHDHPNCDGQLAEYIRQNASQNAPLPQARAQPRGLQQPGPQPQAGGQPTGPQSPGSPQPPNGFQSPAGAQQPGPPQPGGQPQPGAQPPTGSQASQGAQQMAAGAKDLANSAKTYFTNTVAPAAVSAAQTVGQKSGQASASGSVHWTTWFRIAIPILGLFGIITLFMPLVSASYRGYSESMGYFSANAPSEIQSEGMLLLFSFMLVIAFGVTSLVAGRKWAIITVGALAIIAGILGMIGGFGTASNASGISQASVGAGAIFLGLTGLSLIASAVVSFIPLLPKQQHPFPQQPPAQQHPFPQQPPAQQHPFPQQPPAQ